MPAITVTSRNEYQRGPSWMLESSQTKSNSYDDNPAGDNVFRAVRALSLCDEELLSVTSSTIDCSDDNTSTASTDIVIPLPANLSPSREDRPPSSITTEKKVRFHPMAKCHTIDPVSEEDAKRIWLSPLELMLIKKECIFTLWCLSHDHLSHLLEGESAAKQYTTRGLETQARNEDSQIRAQQKRDSLKAVLQEQWSQRKHCMVVTKGVDMLVPGTDIIAAQALIDRMDRIPPASSDQAAIAERYVKNTYDAKQLALLQGLKDEEETRKFLEEPPRPLLE